MDVTHGNESSWTFHSRRVPLSTNKIKRKKLPSSEKKGSALLSAFAVRTESKGLVCVQQVPVGRRTCQKAMITLRFIKDHRDYVSHGDNDVIKVQLGNGL